MTNTLHSVYTNWDIYLIWKPRGLASTQWIHPSLVQCIQESAIHPWVDLSPMLLPRFQEFLAQWNRTEVDRSQTITVLQEQWTLDQEFGLLNRLDTPTGGFLTFATSPKAKKSFLLLQGEWNVDKYYLAIVAWNPQYLLNNPAKTYTDLAEYVSVQGTTITINTPLKHHRHLDDRMVAIKSNKDLTKWRDWLLSCTTTLQVLEQHEKNALVQCVITKWQRHQIRVHCQTLGYPIVWDTLYGKNKEWKLELWCMGYD